MCGQSFKSIKWFVQKNFESMSKYREVGNSRYIVLFIAKKVIYMDAFSMVFQKYLGRKKTNPIKSKFINVQS